MKTRCVTYQIILILFPITSLHVCSNPTPSPTRGPLTSMKNAYNPFLYTNTSHCMRVSCVFAATPPHHKHVALS